MNKAESQPVGIRGAKTLEGEINQEEVSMTIDATNYEAWKQQFSSSLTERGIADKDIPSLIDKALSSKGEHIRKDLEAYFKQREVRGIKQEEEDQLESEIETIQLEIASKNEQIRRLQEKIQPYEDKQNEINALNAQILSLGSDSRITALNLESEALRKEVEQIKKKTGSLGGMLGRLLGSQTITEAQQRISQLEAQMADLRTAIETIASERNQATKKRDQLFRSNEGMKKTEYDQVKQQIDPHHEEAKAYAKQLNVLLQEKSEDHFEPLRRTAEFYQSMVEEGREKKDRSKLPKEREALIELVNQFLDNTKAHRATE